MVKNNLLVVGIVSFLAFASFTVTTLPSRCDCKPEDHPYRALAKHDTACKGLPERRSFITVETIRSWEKKYPVDLLIKTENNGRMSGTPEDTLYHLKGWIYSIKTDKADCDLHIQVGPQDPRKPRVVIEIPPEKCVLQDSLIKQFTRKGFKLNDQNFKGEASR